jgi:hypothetical protein
VDLWPGKLRTKEGDAKSAKITNRAAQIKIQKEHARPSAPPMPAGMKLRAPA